LSGARVDAGSANRALEFRRLGGLLLNNRLAVPGDVLDVLENVWLDVLALGYRREELVDILVALSAEFADVDIAFLVYVEKTEVGIAVMALPLTWLDFRIANWTKTLLPARRRLAPR
jgi:hypothetical protein